MITLYNCKNFSLKSSICYQQSSTVQNQRWRSKLTVQSLSKNKSNGDQLLTCSKTSWRRMRSWLTGWSKRMKIESLWKLWAEDRSSLNHQHLRKWSKADKTTNTWSKCRKTLITTSYIENCTWKGWFRPNRSLIKRMNNFDRKNYRNSGFMRRWQPCWCSDIEIKWASWWSRDHTRRLWKRYSTNKMCLRYRHRWRHKNLTRQIKSLRIAVPKTSLLKMSNLLQCTNL